MINWWFVPLSVFSVLQRIKQLIIGGGLFCSPCSGIKWFIIIFDKCCADSTENIWMKGHFQMPLWAYLFFLCIIGINIYIYVNIYIYIYMCVYYRIWPYYMEDEFNHMIQHQRLITENDAMPFCHLNTRSGRNVSPILIAGGLGILDWGAVKCMTLHLWAANLKPFLVAHSSMTFTACCKCLSMVSRERPRKQIAKSSTKSALKVW